MKFLEESSVRSSIDRAQILPFLATQLATAVNKQTNKNSQKLWEVANIFMKVYPKFGKVYIMVMVVVVVYPFLISQNYLVAKLRDVMWSGKNCKSGRETHRHS